jgi:hypothetical protein
MNYNMEYSATIGRANDYVYESFVDFMEDLIYQLGEQSGMDRSDCNGFLMLPKREFKCNTVFEEGGCTPITARDLAKEFLKGDW